MIVATTVIIMKKGLERGYYMDPEKFLLICKDFMTEADLAMLGEFRFLRSYRERYVGSFIGTLARRRE